MKKWIILGIGLWAQALLADTLPVFTLQPTNQLVTPGVNVTLTAAATAATSYQWRYNGADIPWGTGATLVLTNVQTTNSGYYLAIAKNEIGWTPGQMAYLAVVDTPGVVPLADKSAAYGSIFMPLDRNSVPVNGVATVYAGPELDQMSFVTNKIYQATVTNGYYNNLFRSVPVSTVVPGQNVYYSVYITDTNGIDTQQSTILSLAAGGNIYALPITTNLEFPNWPEWPDDPGLYQYPPYYPPLTQYVAIPGETIAVKILYDADDPTTVEFRKDGGDLPGRVDSQYLWGFPLLVTTLTFTNIQASDAGVYDAKIFGYNWIVSPKFYLTVQTTNGSGVFQSPAFGGTNFICNFTGAISRNYQIQWSTNLVKWNNLTIISNLTGTVTFTNSIQPGNAVFYRSQLLP